MRVIDVCERGVVTAKKDQTLMRAAWLMREHHVGDLVVVQERKKGITKPIGILTDRDMVVAMLAEGNSDFETTTVGDAMSDVLILAGEDDDLDQVMRNMKSNGVRRVPVVDGKDNLVGILTFDDVIGYLTEQMNILDDVIDSEIEREKTQRP